MELWEWKDIKIKLYLIETFKNHEWSKEIA